MTDIMFIFVKWMFVIGLVMYSAFAIVVIRQVIAMSEAVECEVNIIFKVLSWVHLAMSILLFVAALTVL
ncbi:MAG: DUF5657 family protein [Patescibacteria group bacterium]